MKEQLLFAISKSPCGEHQKRVFMEDLESVTNPLSLVSRYAGYICGLADANKGNSKESVDELLEERGMTDFQKSLFFTALRDHLLGKDNETITQEIGGDILMTSGNNPELDALANSPNIPGR